MMQMCLATTKEILELGSLLVELGDFFKISLSESSLPGQDCTL